MSVRYGISLVLEPLVTAALHRARQVICSQYACWAAEMHMVHLPLVGTYECPESQVPALGAALQEIASDFSRDNPSCLLSRRQVTAEPAHGGSIFLEFALGQAPGQLRASVAGIVPGTEPEAGVPALRFALMQHSNLVESVFDSAVTFASGLVEGLELPLYARPAQLVFIRFESEAAGENWSTGGWALDLRWRILASYPL